MRLRAISVALASACRLRCRYCYQRRGPPVRMRWPVPWAAISLPLAGDEAEPELALRSGAPLLELPLIPQVTAPSILASVGG